MIGYAYADNITAESGVYINGAAGWAFVDAPGFENVNISNIPGDPYSYSQTLPWIELGTQTNVVFHVHSDGSIFLGSTTNHITFGSTNTAPASATVAAYVSVKVDGDTNIYRIPLYK